LAKLVFGFWLLANRFLVSGSWASLAFLSCLVFGFLAFGFFYVFWFFGSFGFWLFGLWQIGKMWGLGAGLGGPEAARVCGSEGRFGFCPPPHKLDNLIPDSNG
jgi:hypothetical protein